MSTQTIIKKWQRFTLAAVACLPLSFAQANYADFNQLLPSGSDMSFILLRSNGDIISEHNADRLMVPASTLKILTATAAWLELGAEFRYQTSLLLAPVNAGVIDSDLVLKVSGDPTFSRADLYQMLRQLKTAGVNTIRGDIRFDDSQFAGYDRAAGWPWDDLNVCFSAPISAVMLDSNCVRVSVEPHGNEARINKASHIPLQIESHLRHAPMNTLCPLELYVKQEIYQLHGCLDRKLPLALALANPQQYVKAVIQQQLDELGITLEKKPTHTAATTSYAQHHSAPLPELLRKVLENSDNQISDSLLRTLGAKRYQIGSFQAGIQAIDASFQQHLGFPLSNSDLYDGSGLSRYNLISARTLSTTLLSWQTPQLQPLQAMLPTAGKSGTLRYRKGTQAVTGKLQAKTGSFKQVANLAGFIQTAADDNLVVVQMVNGINGQNSQAREQLAQFEDALYRCIHNSCFQNN
ncbi:MAG: D-alanyl-D-alanine carboxypeptidase/D-alanyl-D-alanine-endopeptidase [Ferrimonas sp.]